MAKVLKKKSLRIIAICLAVAIFILLVLQIGIKVRASYVPYLPDYAKIDIAPMLMKGALTDEDYETLFLQTGLTRLGIDGLLREGQVAKILEIQDQFFEKQDYYLNSFAPFTGYLKRSFFSPDLQYARLENGDILYSPTTFFSFARLGHASLVVDARLGIMAQASGYGNPVDFVRVSHFFSRPTFVILRPSAELGELVANYTSENLIGVRYSLLAGIFGKKAPSSLRSTHCSHFIWYAYMQFGVDLDSNGGKIVTPHDLLYSENLSIVQIYGIDPETIFAKRAKN